LHTWIVKGNKIAVWACAACPMVGNMPAWLAGAER